MSETRSELPPELQPNRYTFADQVRNICSQYGLYSSVFLYNPSNIEGSSRNKLYLVATNDPAFAAGEPPEDFDPEFYMRRNLRSERLFYVDYYIYDMSSNNRLEAMEGLLEYCKYTEFINSLYARYKLEPPQKLRRFEISQLMDAREQQRINGLNSFGNRATNSLKDFFDKEKKTGRTKRWMNFFRSDKFPDDAGLFEKMRTFRKRENPEVSLEQLMACNGHVKTIEMQEHEYKRFSDFMRNAYPFVPFAVSKNIIINHGIGPQPEEIEMISGKRVTGEEYNKILERDFSQKGWESVASLCPSYFKIRKISFISSDEPYIATAFKDATLRFARRDEINTIKERGGELRLHKIPSDPPAAFMNFVSLAKANGLPFYLDNLGWYETPSLAYVNVIYSSKDEDLICAILERIVTDTIDNSHVVPVDERPQLNELIDKATTYLPISEQMGVPIHRGYQSRN